jgi:hypothetical protein
MKNYNFGFATLFVVLLLSFPGSSVTASKEKKTALSSVQTNVPIIDLGPSQVSLSLRELFVSRPNPNGTRPPLRRMVACQHGHKHFKD